MKQDTTWSSCSTIHISMPDKFLVAINMIAGQHKISKSKAAQMLILESKTLNDALDTLERDGYFEIVELNPRFL